MNAKSGLRITLFLAVLVALFIGSVFVVSAATATKSACITPKDVIAPKVCLKATYEFTGGMVRINSKWVTKTSVSGWSVVTTVSPYCNAPCNSWTSGIRSVGASFTWYRNGAKVASRACAQGGDSQNGVLVWAKSCSW